MADAYDKFNMEEPPEQDARPTDKAPKLDPTLAPGYARAKALIADHLQPWSCEWPTATREGDTYTRKVYANFFAAKVIRKDGCLIIMLVGSSVSRFWDKSKGHEVAGDQPLPLKQPLHRLTNLMKERGRMIEQLPAEGHVKLWPGTMLFGQMPRYVPEEDVPALLQDGWLLERSLEVLS